MGLLGRLLLTAPYFNLVCIAAHRTANGVAAVDPRKAHYLAAMGTLLVDMRLALLPAQLRQAKTLPDAALKLKITVVFCAALENVFGKKTEKDKHSRRKAEKIEQQDRPGRRVEHGKEKSDSGKNKPYNSQRPVQLVGAVPTGHEYRKLLPKTAEGAAESRKQFFHNMISLLLDVF